MTPPFAPAEFGPRKHLETQADGGRIQREQFVFEAKSLLANAEPFFVAESPERCIKQIPIEFRGPMQTFVSTPKDLYARNLERANSNQDVRHRVVADFSPEAPERSPLRNFELTGIVTLQSARPFTLFVGYDANSDTVL